MKKGNKKNQSILVVYSSSGGSTEGIARTIGQALASDADVTVVRLGRDRNGWPDPGDYGAVIAGSPIRYDEWMPEMRSFVELHTASLATRPTAFFFSCLSLAAPDREGAGQAGIYASKIRRLVPALRPVDVRGFAGTLRYSAVPFLLRIPFRVFMNGKGISEGDYRDWSAIQEWANGILAPALALREIRAAPGDLART
ncbi:MAG: flavodoxin domain-containing protein [Leptospiraceae bacterium]|nr:flavodoxin domain-containing protein [Leptospiraceae bacterium]